ncbi:MAG: hypothetical protein ACI9QD_000662 [Thermoproteota archaeon]|jgi:hypothetical protein
MLFTKKINYLKMILNFSHSFVLIFLFSSCSWSNINFFSTESSTDKVIEKFDFEDGVVDKFSTDDIKEEKSKKEIKPPKKSLKNKAVKKKVIKKNVSKKSPKKITKKKEIEIVNISEPISNLTKNAAYPDDYPESLIAINKKAKTLWTKVRTNFSIGERTLMDINYLGVVVGKIALEIKSKKKISGKEVFHFQAKLKSAPFYKYIYTLDDTVESYVDVEQFIPYKYSLVQRESKQSIDDIQLFDREAKKSYFRYKKIKRGKKSFKKADIFIPDYFQDALSTLYMIKSLPLEIGDKYDIPMVIRGKISSMKTEVFAIESISTNIGKIKAFRISAHTQYSGDLVKKGQMTYWISADERRIFLKFKAKIKLGAVEGSITSYKR